MTIQEALEQRRQNMQQAEEIRQEAKAAGTWGKSAEEIATIQNIGKDIIERRNVQNKKEETQFKKIDVNSSQIKRDRTKKQYDDYVKSDEYRKRLAENDQRNKQQEVTNLFLPPEMRQAPKVIQDDKEIRLRAAMEQAEQEFKAEEDRKLMEADMEAVTGLSNEDRQQLEQYAVNQIRDQNMPVEFQNMPFFKTAEQEAAGLIDKVGKQRADELAETYMRDQNEKFVQEVAAKGAEHAGTGFWQGAGASAATIPINLVAGLVGSVGQLQGAARNTGRYNTLDPNATGTALQTYTGAVRGKVGQNISGDVYDEEGKLIKDGGAFRGAMALGYQGAMSIADSAARAALGRVIGTVALNATDYAGKGRLVAGMAGSALAAANSFSQTLSEASARGATPKQAITLATATSAIEALSEKIPLDELVNTATIGKQSGKEIVSRALKQAGIELTTEEISFAASILAETAILKEKSSYKTAIVKKILEGESPEAAKMNTLREILQEAKETAIVSAISGFGSSTGSSVLGNMLADTTLNTTSPEQKTVEEVKAEQAQAAEQTAEPVSAAEQQAAPAPEQKADVSKVVADMVRENTGKQQTQEATQQPQAEVLQPAQTEAAPQTQQQEQPKVEQREAPQHSTQQADTRTDVQQRATERVTEYTEGQQQETLGKQNAPSGDIEQSRTFTNTGRKSPDADIRKGYRETMRDDRNAANYEVKHNVDTLATAQERTQSPEQARAEADYLVNKDYRDWTAEDNVTALLTIQKLTQEGGEGAAKLIASVAAQRKQANVHAGQLAQSNRIIGTMKAADNTVTAVDTFINSMESMTEGQTTYSKKSGKDFESWKQDIETAVTEIGIAIESVDAGDAGAMRNVIRQIAQERKTTAWFGTSDQMTPEANKILNKLDYDTLKKIANTQLASMADDYRKRSKKEVAVSLRKQSMLSSLKTIARNISGNTVGGIADAVSESGAGRLADMVMSKFTGKKTVGSDIFNAKEYATAAKEAGQFASLCVELNIPIETDIDASFNTAAGNGSNEKYIGRTFRSTGNPAMRVLYAYQKYMSYALEVTDKVFEGGTNAAVEASLNRLKNSNLTDEDVQKLSSFTAQKRTFKNATWEDTNANGEKVTRGSEMARAAGNLKKTTGVAGEVAAPFVSTPMNVAQTGIDYTVGAAKGIGEMVAIIKDAKAGKTIPVERQRQAASDFGRGVMGPAAVALFAAAAAAGALKVTNPKDWDKEALDKAEGRTGAQMNWDALLRGLQGGDGNWQSGDVVSSVDFLEPFNTQMYLGYEMAEFAKDAGEDATWLDKATTYGKASAKSVLNSIMDSPVMTGLQDISDLIDDIKEAEENPEDIANAVAAYAGDVASSFIPQAVRQIAQYTDGYYRDTKGKNAAETALNSIKAAIPGLSQTLPVKYSGLGEAQKRGGAFETFVDPTATFRYEENKVTTYLDELSERTGDDSIYPSKQAPMRFDVGGETVELTPQQRETYQKTYGEKVNALYSGIMDMDDFEKLPDAMKSEALNAAEEYARKTAMAAVSEYKDAPKAKNDRIVSDVVADTVRSAINKQFDKIETAEYYGRSTDEASTKMDEFYKVYADLSKSARQNVKNEAKGDTAKYIEAREKGISHADFITTARNVNNVKGTGKNGTVRDIDRRQAIAKTTGLTPAEVDKMMKVYMPDYDKTDESPETTEFKYQYIREELDLSPAEYARTYKAYLDGEKKAGKIADIMRLGYDWKTANAIYKVHSGSMKQKLIAMYG